MASSYSLPPLEVLSFSEDYGFMYIGFWFMEEEEKKKQLELIYRLLANLTLENSEELGAILKARIAFVHIEHKRLIYQLNYVNMDAYINAEVNFKNFLGKYLAFLSHKEKYKLQDILNSNFLHFLTFLLESKKNQQVLTKEAQSLEKYIDFNAYENLKKEKENKEKSAEEETFNEEDSYFSLEPLNPEESYSWFKFYTIDENFPLFEGNESNNRLQRAIFQLTSAEGSLPTNLIEKFWTLYRQEQDFLDFIEFTLQCQHKITELRI